ncbi:finTRIM family, member 14 [Silurus asotus]|uniref:FinTRIM family, member 14 n=1 Tax=Silurus asotus TaxID=30991 RepID=A0AAD5AIZ6_SILAS|nr:finTRIM family, member 14 [Silurus asotus]
MASILVDQDDFICPVCLDLLTEPVTTPCGHSFCKVCINDCWDQEDENAIYSCPHCRNNFTPRPVLHRNNSGEVVEKVKKTDVQVASPAHCDTGPGDVECDFCTGEKVKATKFCLVCVASICEVHLKPHTLKKHTLTEASAKLQKICSEHNKLIEIYCRTDQTYICHMCTTDNHKGHEIIMANAERAEKQGEFKKQQMKSQLRIQEKQKNVQELKQAVKTIKLRAQTALEDSDRFFTKLISSLEKKRSEMREMIQAQEKAELDQAEQLLEQLEEEIADLQRRVNELEQLSHKHDHILFLQILASGRQSPPLDRPNFYASIHQHVSFDEVRNSLSVLKKRFQEFDEEEFNTISPHVLTNAPAYFSAATLLTSTLISNKNSQKFTNYPLFLRPDDVLISHFHSTAAEVQNISPPEPWSRVDFLKYFCYLTLDPNTAHHNLILSEKNRVVTYSEKEQHYSDHPERFDSKYQVLSKESVCGRCYWEVEWSGVGVDISVSYKDISRKGDSDECAFGQNNRSWNLWFSPKTALYFYHNTIKTDLKVPTSSRIGVYVDHSAGTLSFYSVSDTMTLLHRIHTTFTQPLYAGFGPFCLFDSNVRLCDPM